ncbi:MAG: hypothetical protein OHK93_005255 [Ramalina farinacea]|uniref:Uncharacterized protein n=1 Tax=Ramalina farinacea TaxID=258253 RepID=A0AA43QVS6_9LECA|nr:hypothetical protein [Ramalina farinacea]
MSSLSLMASQFDSMIDFAQFVEQHLVDQTAKSQAHKLFLEQSYFEAIEQARAEIHESMQQDFVAAVSQEGNRIEFLKNQEAVASESRTRQQFANDFKVQVALNKDSLEADLRAQYDEKLAGRDELLRQKELELSELRSALASSKSTNKDLTSRIKEQEESCAQKTLKAQKKIQELEGAQAASSASLNSANNQIGQLQHQVQARQNDIQARDSQIERCRQELANETAAHSTPRSNYDSISQSLTSVTNQRDQAQRQFEGVNEEVGKLRAKNGELQSQLSEFERRTQKSEDDWAQAKRYIQKVEEERDSLRSRVQEFTALSPHMETDELEHGTKAGASGVARAASEQQVVTQTSNVSSDESAASEEGEHDNSVLDPPAPSRRAKQPASAKSDVKSHRIGKKKPGKATKVVNVKAVKAKDGEVLEEFEEGAFMYSGETVESRPEWDPTHPNFNLNLVTTTHEDFDHRALQYAVGVQFKLQQQQNKAADDSVKASKAANESLLDQINNLNW